MVRCMKKIKKFCLECGKEFECYRPEAMFCSSRCRDRNYYIKNKKPKAKKEKICIGCGKPFIPNVGARKFCTAECRKEYYKKAITPIYLKNRKDRDKQKKRDEERVISYKSRREKFARMAEVQQKTGVSYGLQVALKPEQLKTLIQYKVNHH